MQTASLHPVPPALHSARSVFRGWIAHECFCPPGVFRPCDRIGDDPIARARLCARTTSCYRIRRKEASLPCYVEARTHDKPQLPGGRGVVRMAAARAVTGLTRPADMARPEGLVRCVR